LKQIRKSISFSFTTKVHLTSYILQKITWTMKKFSIKDLEALSGIKAHTLRAWEHRYDFIKPQRTDANFRYYTPAELKQLLDIVLLNKNGHKISQLARLDAAAIEERISRLPGREDKKQRALNELLVSMYTLKTETFEETLEQCTASWPVKEVMQDIIFAFLKRIGLLWCGSRLIEEHFAVTAIRKKLIAGIDTLRSVPLHQRCVLLFLPEGRQLDLGLLYTHYLLKQHGLHILYMGSDVSIDNLKEVLAYKHPQYLFTYLPQKHRFRYDELATSMKEQVPNARLIVATYPGRHAARGHRDQLLNMEYEDALHYLMQEEVQ